MTPEQKLARKIIDSRMTVKQIADQTDINETTVGNYANQNTRLSQLEKVYKFSRLLNFDITELFEDAPSVDNNFVTIEDLTYKIEDWFYDRNLHNQEPSKQFLKVAEEVGELGGALARQDEALITDALGDVFVTLIGIAMQTDIDFTAAVQSAYDEIKDRKGKLVGGVFIKDN